MTGMKLPDDTKAIEELKESIAKLHRPPNVLVVDDDEGVRLSLSTILKSFHCSITQSIDGREALQSLKNQSFDLVFLDIRMPVISGVEVYEYIRLNHPNLPVVVVTGYEADNIRKLGAAIVLPKPIELDVLRQIFSWVRI